jgi:hypothetical protein
MLPASRRPGSWPGLVAVLSLLLILGSTPANAQINNAGSVTSPPPVRFRKLYKLDGTVVNAITGEPIPRALVQIYGQAPSVVMTDSGGHFEFHDLPQMETVTIMVRKPGFHPEGEIDGLPNSGQTLVKVGPDAPPVVVRLILGAIIFGRVESAGEPVERIPIKIFWPRMGQGHRYWQRRDVITDEDGNFRVADLLPGNYYISAGPGLDNHSMTVSPADANAAFATTFHTGANDFEEATPVALSAGQQIEVDFAIKKLPTYKLTGTITGNPPGTSVSLDFKDSAGENFYFPMHYDDITQQFSVRVPAGSYVLGARSQNKDGVQLSTRLPVRVNSDMTGVGLVLQQSPSIPVSVRLEYARPESSPQSNLSFRIRKMGRLPLTLGLESAVGSINKPSYWAGPDQSSNSGLLIQNVEPGKYNLQIHSYGPWYVQSATSGSTDLLRQEFEVDARPQAINVVLRDDDASINATVRSEERLRQVAVLLVREDAPRDVVTTYIVPGGQFTINGLAPGNYSVLAFESVENLEYSKPEVLSDYLQKATHVTLQANQSLDLTIDQILRTK